jgi:hypothetical protein
MPRKGFICDEEYLEKYYASPAVKFHLEVFTEMAKQPKSQEVRDKMSEAKKGVPKTEEHRKHLSEAQKHRHLVFRRIKQLHPELTKAEIWVKVKEFLNDLSD